MSHHLVMHFFFQGFVLKIFTATEAARDRHAPWPAAAPDRDTWTSHQVNVFCGEPPTVSTISYSFTSLSKTNKLTFEPIDSILYLTELLDFIGIAV